MRRIIFLSIVCLFCAVSVMAADKLVVSDVTVAQGKEAVLDIGCEMQMACKAFQMDVELGSGFTLKLDAAGKPEAELGTATDHKIYSRRVSDGKYRFVVISMNGQQLPTSGSLLKLTVVAPSTAQAGSSVTCSVKAIEFATAQTKPLVLSNATFKVTIATPPPKGDVNLDNTVDVADIATIIDVMAGGSGIATSLQQVADVNEDGTVDVADIATVIDIMAGNDNNYKVKVPDNLEAVDLGLPSGTKWANMNVGAERPEDYGLYFAWGETVGYSSDTSDGRTFDYENYKWKNDQTYMGDGIFKYDYGMKSKLDLEDDAANANWGGKWSIPSSEDVKELEDNTSSVWTSINGINGRKFTSKINGQSIFFPAPGYRKGNSLLNEGKQGFYWESNSLIIGLDWIRCATTICIGNEEFSDNLPDFYEYYRIWDGRSVRPVLRK